jgi:hypothetical protein
VPLTVGQMLTVDEMTREREKLTEAGQRLVFSSQDPFSIGRAPAL